MEFKLISGIVKCNFKLNFLTVVCLFVLMYVFINSVTWIKVIQIEIKCHDMGYARLHYINVVEGYAMIL